MDPEIPDRPGSYVLILTNPNTRCIWVGRLGEPVFPPGLYAYVGSAMGGLSKRVSRYLKGVKKSHWHIDALLPSFRLDTLWLFPSPIRQECAIARFLDSREGILSIKGFGSTDCACPSHLFLLKGREKAPLFDQLKEALDCREALAIAYS